MKSAIIRFLFFLLTMVPGWAGADLITFDVDAFGNPIDAPPLFGQTVALRELYAPLGVHFEGAGLLDGGAILNELSSFGLSASSGLNFLAFNPDALLSDGGLPMVPQIITFDFAVALVSMRIGGGSAPVGVTLKAYDSSGELLDEKSDGFRMWKTLTVTGSGIRKVVMTTWGANGSFVVDDLAFSRASANDAVVPEPPGLHLLGLGSAIGLAIVRFRTR